MSRAFVKEDVDLPERSGRRQDCRRERPITSPRAARSVCVTKCRNPSRYNFRKVDEKLRPCFSCHQHRQRFVEARCSAQVTLLLLSQMNTVTAHLWPAITCLVVPISPARNRALTVEFLKFSNKVTLIEEVKSNNATAASDLKVTSA